MYRNVTIYEINTKAGRATIQRRKDGWFVVFRQKRKDGWHMLKALVPYSALIPKEQHLHKVWDVGETYGDEVIARALHNAKPVGQGPK